MLLRLTALVLTAATITTSCLAQGRAFKAPGLSEQESFALQTARTHEARGEEALAFEVYRHFIQFDRDAVDVDLKFAAMTRARLGAEAARALFQDFGAKLQSPALKLAAATLVDLGERRKALEAFVAAYPDYGPAYALLAADYYRDRVEEQSLHDRLRERELLSRFLGLDAQGKLGESFVDSSILAAWIDHAERRLATLDAALTNAIAAPVAMFTRSNSDWMIHLSMPEEPSELSYRVGEAGPYITTPPLGSVNARTGRKIVATHFSMLLETPKTTLYVKYRDVSGREAGPFPIKFDPNEIMLQRDRETLAREQPGWLAFTTGTNQEWVYFNTILQTRCVIKSVEYGFNEQPNKPFPLPPCDMRDPWRMPADAQSAVRMTLDVKFVSVRLTFTDGRTESRIYRRPAP